MFNGKNPDEGAKSLGTGADPKCKCCGGTGWYYINHGNQGFERILCDCVEE